jgi:hypothetical protein
MVMFRIAQVSSRSSVLGGSSRARPRRVSTGLNSTPRLLAGSRASCFISISDVVVAEPLESLERGRPARARRGCARVRETAVKRRELRRAPCRKA